MMIAIHFLKFFSWKFEDKRNYMFSLNLQMGTVPVDYEKLSPCALKNLRMAQHAVGTTFGAVKSQNFPVEKERA
jgi:hypothetical protein